MGRGEDRIVEFLYRAGNWVVCFVGSAIFLGLAGFSSVYTYDIKRGIEIPVIQYDSEIANLAALILAVGLLAVLMKFEKRIGEKGRLIIRRVTLALWHSCGFLQQVCVG